MFSIRRPLFTQFPKLHLKYLIKNALKLLFNIRVFCTYQYSEFYKFVKNYCYEYLKNYQRNERLLHILFFKIKQCNICIYIIGLEKKINIQKMLILRNMLRYAKIKNRIIDQLIYLNKCKYSFFTYILCRILNIWLHVNIRTLLKL